MNWLIISNSIFICLWILLVAFLIIKKEKVKLISKLFWIPIGLTFLHYFKLFFQTNEFPIRNFEHFSIILIFLIIVMINIVYLKNEEMVVYCYFWCIPIYIVAQQLLQSNTSTIPDFSSYSQIILFFHIMLVALGQMCFTLSFIGAVIILWKTLKKKSPKLLHLTSTLLISFILILCVVFRQYSLFALIVALIVLKRFLPLNNMDMKKVYQFTKLIVLIGVFFFSVGALIFGMIWANIAWGRFWSWDPKETWALISFLIYVIYIHWKPVNHAEIKSSLFLVLAFIILMVNFIYINFFVDGLHSYALEMEIFFTKS